MATFKFRPRVENIQVALHFFVFVSLAFLIFSNNPSCLFFTLDGAYATITHDLQALARTPFTELGADPLQGNFDAYFPPFQEYLLPNLLAMLFGDGNPAKATTYTVYAGLMILAVYLLGRAVHIDRAPALFAGLLYPLPTLPMFIGSLLVFYPAYALAPHYTQVSSLTLLALVFIWELEEQPILRSTLLALGALFCTVWIMVSSTLIVLSIPTLLFFSVASLLSARRWQLAVPRIITGVLIFIALAALGLVGYVYGLYKYAATSFFHDEFLNPRAGAYSFASVIYDTSVGRMIAAGGIAGAVYSAIVGQRRLRVFALAYLAYTAIFQVLAFTVTKWLHTYAGPSPVYFEFILWPLNILFTAVAFFAVIDAIAFFAVIVAGRRHAVPRFSAWHRSFLRYSSLGIVGLGLLAGNATAAPTDRCGGLKQFSRISPTPVTERLQETIAFRPGSLFRGLVATFTGYQEKYGVSLNDLIPHDIVVWEKTGNDHRTVGLWRYYIPTLFQYSQFTTPPYYLTLSRFLSRPEDTQMRNMVVLTRPDERMLKLWGVRFVIADFDPGFGTSRVTFPVTGQQPLRLIELDDFNHGQYSPTKVINAKDFRSALDFMRNPSFDGSLEVVTDANLPGGLRAAEDVELKVEKYGLSIRASSSGQSLLVLPAQFSHCWSVYGEGNAVLFRADIMQLGISFKGRLDASLVFRYGPILAGHCRLEDLRDMERLDLRGARSLML
jgi:hypothetical protein